MRHTPIILILSFFLSYSTFAQGKPDKEQDKLIGQVRSVSMINCDKNKGGRSEIIYTTTYDMKGNIVEVTHFDDNGAQRRSKFINSYDSQGRLREKITDNKSVIYSREEYDYSSGHLIKKTYENNSEQPKTKEIYNLNKDIIEKISYGENGVVQEKALYTYDDEGNNIELMFYDANGLIISKWRNIYDKKGNRTEDALYDWDGSLLKKHIYTYDVQGNMIGVSYYQSGVLVTEETYTYEYDVHGNWIKKITFGVGRTSTVCRSITYY